ncbi:hypothetical protein HMPREF1990_00137 [Porphyromonas gingivalis W4087]|uniref:Uncharacterized protein n=1 Tax=Porphyromonas gingivalis F0570 TaxID=1227271 RepID=A0A0E2LQ86_PORGN|nr:hypothetical protein HMPREF1555_01347 [Porphyromonas gingivalis F0570]ERJ91245.1 hypothetical protein HMPREF1990_00137 [Porphyromonas gingivalis W4087]
MLLGEILPLEIQLGLAFDGELVICDTGGTLSLEPFANKYENKVIA